MVTTVVVMQGTYVPLKRNVMKWPASSAPADILRALPSHEVVTTLWFSVDALERSLQEVNPINVPLSLV